LEAIVAQQETRLAPLGLDGLIVYDLQDEGERTSAPRPFPFLPTVDPYEYAHQHLGRLALPKVVYRCVSRDTAEDFVGWLGRPRPASSPLSVLVGAASRRDPPACA
jgi:hypothetical protein